MFARDLKLFESENLHQRSSGSENFKKYERFYINNRYGFWKVSILRS